MSCGGDEKLQAYQPDYGGLLSRSIGAQQDISGNVLGALSPILQVDDLTLPEYRWLRRMQTFSTFGTVAALAGNVSGVQFFRRTTQGRAIAVVHNIIITNLNAAAASFQLGITFGVPNLGTLTVARMDDRQPALVAPGGISQFEAQTFQAAVAPAVFGPFVRLQPSTSMVLPNVFMVGAGASLLMMTGAANLQFACSFDWRERSLIAQEG